MSLITEFSVLFVECEGMYESHQVRLFANMIKYLLRESH